MTETTRYERLAQRNLFDEFLALRDLQRKQRETAEIIARGKEIPEELNRQGFMKWYMGPMLDDIVMKTFIIYVQRIPAGSRSGKQLFQGHQIGFIWKGGPGYTVIDEVRYDWDRWDVVQIPLKVKGVVVQHFNDSDDDIEIIFTSLNHAHSASIDRGSGFEQLEDCPEYRASRR
ncbi:MAG: hypothetical protein AB1679_02045 [Actinomycetota bacterium]|jgi:hypothetical protein